MTSIIDFLSHIIELPERYNFILYIVAGVFALVLLDGIISFLFSGISDLTSRR